jgi:type I restriction enzyme S subunit
MSRWPHGRLEDVLKPFSEYVEAPEPRPYPKLSVRLYGKGVVLDTATDGALLKMKRHQLAKAGQVIVSEIWGKKGAVGLVPPDGAGALCTSHFFLFDVQRDRVDPKFLDLIFKANYLENQLNAEARGTTGYAAVRPKHFLACEIPLPVLAEQRRMVARIEEMAGQIKEACALRQQATEATKATAASYLGRLFATLATTRSVHRLGELTSDIVDGPHQTPQYLPEGSVGIPFVTVKNMVTGTLDFSNLKYISEQDHRVFTKRCRAEYGDVLYSKDGATRGRPCLVATNREFSYFVSVALIKPLRDRLDGRYLVHLLNSNWIRDRMIGKSRGDMIPHIVLREISAFPVPLPPLEEQGRIVAELNVFQERMDALRRLQEDTAAELDALLSAVLDRAFKGELV